MLVLTEAAVEVVKSVTDTPQAPGGTGLRITQSEEEPGGGANALQLAAAAQPGDYDQIVETSGARLFLDPPAAAYLDDKVLDAQVDAQGQVRFTLEVQNPRGA
jgi:iron-sulfur cluster assembly protein